MKKVKVRFTGNEELIKDYIDAFNWIPEYSPDLVISPVNGFVNVSKPYPNRGSDDVRIYADLVWYEEIDERIKWKPKNV